MPKIVDYTIIEEKYSINLIEEVERYISNGWQPFGGVVVNGEYYTQAMIKEDKDNEV